MYLSRLEMVGFKSFGLKTDLSFNDGVTAIVGPNGCGKTNIVDAIRWVLGEQKTSMLRADSMEHVIFNGSKHRKPLGMAEVSLTIENNKRILPTEYSQVVITRRLFRSGESQYLLNRTACRLKDIVELFMDTGMGANAYSVIELKMIETILSDKADERRHLFEEAAGVTKYKARRKEAQRKLEAAQRDIARVADIVREVQKTVNSLGRQAEKARQHQEISAQLRELDRKLFYYEYNAERASLSQAERWVEDVLKRHTAASALLAEREQAVDAAEQAHEVAESTVRTAVDHEGQVRTSLGEVSGTSSVLAERIASTQRTIERLESENTQSADEKHTTSEKLQAVWDRMSAVGSELRSAAEEHNARKEAEAQMASAISEVRSSLQGARGTLGGLVQQQNDLRREHDRIGLQAQSVQRRLEDATQGVEQHAARAAEVAEGMREQGLVLPELDQQLQLAEQALHAAEARQQQLRVEQEQQQTMLDQLRSTEAHSRASLEFLVGLVDTTESSKFLMNSDEWKPSGEKLTLAEVLNTSDELRVAVEAALGDAARYFVVANRAEANQAIGALSRNNIGKATFLCRDAIPNLPEPPAINHEGGVRGWASELVLCDDALRGALRGILGRTVIAEDLEAAWQAVQGTQAERAVTLAGEVVHRAGAVRGGSTSRTEGVRVGRRERINQLRGELATLEQQVEQAVVTAQQLKDEYAGIDLRALGEVVRQATVSANAVQQRLESMRGRLADIEGTAAKLREEVEGCRVELEQLGVAQADTERQLAAIGEGVVAAEADVRSQEEQLIQAEAAAQEATARQREAEILVVRLDGELQSLQADEARLSDQNLTIDQRREQREQERTQLAQQLTSLSAEREQASRQASVLMQQVAAASAARQDAELTLQETVAATHAASEAVRAQRRAVEALVHEQHEADLKLNAAQLKIEQLERHAAEELELIRGSEFNAPGEGEVVAPSDTEGPDLVREQAQELRRKLTLMGNVNFLALEEHERENERFQFLSTQLADLTASEKTLAQTILEINQTARELFTSTFAQIRDNFTQLFKLLFSEDDEADLQMVETEDNDPLECKVEIIAKPRGKRPHGIEMLSGGEKTLTAIALLFAIYLVKPSPFCILDEVDAPLDDANIDRYLKIIRKFSENTQFLMITHNKRTMEAADTLYGVTMEEPAVSKVVSVQLGGERRSESAKEAA